MVAGNAHTGRSGAERIHDERRRHIEEEGMTPQLDYEMYHNDELIIAACLYALSACQVREMRGMKHVVFPFPKWDKREKHSQLRKLEIAGSLIAAEIDRLQNALELGGD